MATINDFGSPTDPLNAPSHSEWAAAVATSLAGKLDLSGGTMTGALDLSVNPSAPTHATKMKYVDDRERALSVNEESASWNDFTAPGPYNKLLHGTFNPDGPGISAYFYLTNYIYSGTVDEDLTGAHTRNLTQFAIPYTGPTIALRSRYSSVWSAWFKFTGT